MNRRSGFVAIIGLPNAGKSTLLNTLIRQKLSIVSPKPQTTRYRIEGIYQSENSQIIFVDTPGFIRAEKGLEHILQVEIEEAISSADIMLFLFEPKNILDFEKAPFEILEKFIHKIKDSKKPLVIAINKVDISKRELIIRARNWIESLKLSDKIIEISALTGENIKELIETIEMYLPESEFLYDPEQVAIKSERFLCQELIREQLFYFLKNEVPYECAVSIEEFDEDDRYSEAPSKQIVRIDATIIVSRESLKPIVIGRGGEMIKKIGTNARHEIECLLECRVYLNLRVIVKHNWTKDRFFLKDLGYEKV